MFHISIIGETQETYVIIGVLIQTDNNVQFGCQGVS